MNESEYILFLKRRIRELQEENKRLKRVLMLEIEKVKIDWRKIASNSKYDEIIIDCIKRAIKQKMRPVSADDIMPCVINETRIKLKHIPKVETITRRMRALRKEGILYSPSQGKYTLVNKSNEKERILGD